MNYSLKLERHSGHGVNSICFCINDLDDKIGNTLINSVEVMLEGSICKNFSEWDQNSKWFC